MEEFKFRKELFGKYVDIVLFDIPKDIAEDISGIAYKEGLRLSNIFNFYDKNSELSRLNRDRRIKPSSELLKLIKIAKEFSELIKGEYDITFGKNFRERKENKPLTKLSCSYKDISINNNEIVLNNPDVEIDLGSIAKGFIVDKIVESLQSQGVLSGIVDGRGDIRVFGEAQRIGIQDPRRDRIINYIKIKDNGIATSGDYSQYDKSFDKSHIINQKELISVTVVAEDLMTADLFATAIFVSNKALNLLEKRESIKVMTIDKSLNIKYYNNLEEILE